MSLSRAEYYAQAAAARADCVDEGDRAQALAQLEVADALASRYEPPADPPRRLPSGQVVCWDCDAPIPAARLAVVPGAVRCQPCQAEVEYADELARRAGRG